MRLTTSGILFLLVGAALIVAAYRFSLPGLLPAGILVVGLVVVSALLALLTSTRVGISTAAHLPRVDGLPLAEVGSEAVVVLTVSNRSPVPLGEFEVRLVPSDGFGPERTRRMPGMAGFETTEAEIACTPTHRGVSGIRGAALSFDGPFGLVSVRSKVRADAGRRIAVAVPVEDLRVARPPREAVDLSDDSRLTRGASTLDYHTREYVAGDDLRHVHWASTARVGELMVRQEAQEVSPTAVVVLDTSGPDPSGRGADLAVSAATAAAVDHLRAGDELHMVSGGRRFRALGERGVSAVRLESARHPTGAEAPAQLHIPAGAQHVAVCALTRARAEAILETLPRGQAASAYVVEDLGDLTADLDTAIFGGVLPLPEAWTARGRSRR